MMNRDFILFKIGRIHNKTNKFLLKELSDHGIIGISPSHGEIIGSLLKLGPLQMKQIAEIVGKDKSTVTVLVEKLIREGYVEKSKDHEDNRIYNIQLTKKGKALLPGYKEISRKLRDTSYRGFSEKEKERLYNMLERLENNL